MRQKSSNSGRTVNDLPLGEGEGIIVTKDNKKIRVKGRVAAGKRGGRNLHVFRGNSGNPGAEKLSFGGGTKVRRWRRK